MSIKKSNRWNLRERQVTGFLMGLVLALSLLYVSLEYTSVESLDEDDEENFDVSWGDMDLAPLQKHDNMIAVPSPPPPKAVTADIKPVDVAVVPNDKLGANSSETPEGTDAPQQAKEEPQEVAPSQAMTDEVVDFRVVEKIPEFPGGMAAFTQWLTKHLKYPPEARQRKIEGKVVVSFIINKDGIISDQKIEKSANPWLDAEAMRVIRMMPKWKPGMEDNKPCRTLFAIPIIFQL